MLSKSCITLLDTSFIYLFFLVLMLFMLLYDH